MTLLSCAICLTGAERHWSDHKLLYPLALLTSVAYSTINEAKTQLEWMAEEVSNKFGQKRNNPFDLRRGSFTLSHHV